MLVVLIWICLRVLILILLYGVPFQVWPDAQANCNSYGSAIDCSYSTAATENVNVPNAQIGEVYVLLITNYASVSQQITLTQTGGSGATDCSIVDPCVMTFLDANLTACTCWYV